MEIVEEEKNKVLGRVELKINRRFSRMNKFVEGTTLSMENSKEERD